MTRILLTASAVVIGLALASLEATAGPRDRIDRIEDRIDRRESFIDRQTDNGRRDRIEDRIDRAESIADRRGREVTPGIDRHERRSWWRLWGNGAS